MVRVKVNFIYFFHWIKSFFFLNVTLHVKVVKEKVKGGKFSIYVEWKVRGFSHLRREGESHAVWGHHHGSSTGDGEPCGCYSGRLQRSLWAERLQAHDGGQCAEVPYASYLVLAFNGVLCSGWVIQLLEVMWWNYYVIQAAVSFLMPQQSITSSSICWFKSFNLWSLEFMDRIGLLLLGNAVVVLWNW